MWMVADTNHEALVAEAAITPPRQAKPQGGSVVLPPGQNSPKSKSQGIETPADRKKRLQDAGVLPTPTPVPENKGKLSKELDKIAANSTTADGDIVAPGFRLGFDFGPWFAVVKPKDTEYVPDFSYGVSAFFPIDTQSVRFHSWTNSSFVGPVMRFYNGGTYAPVKEVTGETVQLYGDTNFTEIGVAYSKLLERRMGEASTLGLDYRAQFLPIKIYKGYYQSYLKIPKDSEVRSHYAVNYAGFGASFYLTYGFARLANISAFVDTHFSTPFQMRFRYGLAFETIDFDSRKNENDASQTSKGDSSALPQK